MPDYGLLNYGLRSIGDSVRSGQKFLLQSRRLDQTDRSLKIAEDQNRRQAEAYAQKKRLNRMRDSSNKINVSRLQAQKEGLNYSDYLKKNPAMLNTVVRGVMENAPGLKGILPEGVKASFVLDNDQKIRAYDESGKLISNSDGSSLEVSFDEFEAETMSQSIQAGAYFALSAQRDLERDYKTGAISATAIQAGPTACCYPKKHCNRIRKTVWCASRKSCRCVLVEEKPLKKPMYQRRLGLLKD